MDISTVSIVLRVTFICTIFAFFVFIPLKSRYRYDSMKTAILISSLIGITGLITILFLTSGGLLSQYSNWGIILWICSAILIFRLTIKGSYLEILFTVLVVLNLYVNIVAIAKIIVSDMKLGISPDVLFALTTVIIFIAYMPLLWNLFFKLYKKVIEFNIYFSFWKFIWIIPALTYAVFYVKIINDYWKNPVQSGTGEIMFSVFWSLTTYIFFWVTLKMLIHAYQGIAAIEQMKSVTSQLRMQEEQYKRLLDYIEKDSRNRHDWRHHLLMISGFAENGELGRLKEYLKKLMPEYAAGNELILCRNHIVDVILQHYTTIAQSSGISINTKADIPERGNIPDTDLCVIFGNLIENAVEACMVQSEGGRQIEIKVETKGNQLVIMIRNTYGTEIIRKNGIYYSTKHEGPGIGIQSVEKIVEKYDGIVKVEWNEAYFNVYILLKYL